MMPVNTSSHPVTNNKSLKDYPMDQVSITDPYYVNASTKEIQYLKNYNLDRLLAGFRENRGLLPKNEKYPGWEHSEIKGHTLGHYLTALSQAFLSTKDEEILTRLEYAMAELALCQSESGYLSAFSEQLFDNVENKQPAWVPWYTMHKIIAGITAVYHSTHNKMAYDIVTKLGEWVFQRTSAWSPEIQERVLSVEYGGMNDCLYDLYKISDDKHHLSAAHSFDELSLFIPIRDGKDILKGKHANTTIPKFLGALKRYMVLGESERFYLEASQQFWEMVVHHHSYITGGNSEWEHFGDPDALDRERSNFTAETCNSYNMLKLSRELFKITGDVKYADFYENTYINAILSSQNPDTGMTMYFQPMATGYFKVYSSPFEHFWCCTGTGMESFTKLNDSIYFHGDNSIYVNQYLSSTLNSEEHQVELIQTANIPYEDTVQIKVQTSHHHEHQLAIYLREPDWIAGNIELTLNDQNVDYKVSQHYVCIDRVWKDGDIIHIRIPMKASYFNLPDAKNVIAFKYGPVVLSAGLGQEDMTESATGVAVSVPTKNILIKDFITTNNQNVQSWLENIEDYFIQKKDGLAFTLRNTDEDDHLVFTPHFKQHQERYGIYWSMVESDSPALQQHILQTKLSQRVQDATIDSLPVGNDQYELEHHIKGQNTSVATWDGFNIRQAENNGWFSYQMKTIPHTDNYLSVTYFSGSNGKTIDIYIDGELLVSDHLMNEKERSFYTKNYLIAADKIKDKMEMEVKFVVPGQMNGIFDLLRMMTNYDTSADLTSLSFDAGVYTEPFLPNQTEYTLMVSNDLPSVQMNAVPAHRNALVYVNGILIEDMLPRSIPLQEVSTELKIIIKAEDHVIVKEYNVTILKE
jgi:DUF1680 family protein